MRINFKKKKLLIIILVALVLPVILWVASGAGIIAIKLHFGLMPNDVTHQLYMNDEELRKTLPPEKYEAWKKRTEQSGD